MADQAATLLVELDAEGADDQELDEMTTRLRRQLLDLDVDRVERPSAGPAPPGTRAVEIAAVGALLVSMYQSSKVLSSVTGALRSFAARGQARRVKITLDGDSIELTGAADEAQQRLIDLWLERHSKS
jgi:hypothetical protein